MNKFTVSFTFEIESGVEIGLIVSGIQIPYTPANKRGHPDCWTPAENGFLEDLEICNSLGTPLPMLIQDKLAEDEAFLATVEAALEVEDDE